MSGPTDEGSPPPEVPEEFAAAYRAAYERALAAQSGGPQHRGDPEDAEGPEERGGADDDTVETRLPRRPGPLRVGTHRSEEDDAGDERATPYERVRDSRWFVPVLLALLALLLILGAYAVGRRFADHVQDSSGSGDSQGVVTEEGGAHGTPQRVTNQRPGKDAWKGKVARLGDVHATVGCTSPPGVDSGGAKVSYDAGNLTDGVAATTWRCDGPATGQKITLDLGKAVPVGQVGLIPGYAKTDEKSKADRFAENNRITRVRWTIGETDVVQRMSGAADDRSLQLIRVPRTSTDTVVLQILAVRKGPRNTTAISEIQLGRAG
jgi:hypothetical protein